MDHFLDLTIPVGTYRVTPQGGTPVVKTRTENIGAIYRGTDRQSGRVYYKIRWNLTHLSPGILGLALRVLDKQGQPGPQGGMADDTIWGTAFEPAPANGQSAASTTTTAPTADVVEDDQIPF